MDFPYLAIYQWIWAAKLKEHPKDKGLYEDLKRGVGKNKQGTTKTAEAESKIAPQLLAARRWSSNVRG